MTVINPTPTVRLASILDVRSIQPDLKATDRWEAIDELVDVLVAARNVSKECRDAVSGVVKARESSASTGIGSGIAIPHAQTPFVERVVAAVGRSTRGIDFESLDGRPVKLVVLILVPQGQFQKHLSTLAGIARLLSDKAFRAKLEQSTSAAVIFDLIQKSAV
jgi:mannitol/fructose-specific phosphotransferase system IIA component (Ntr-type)